MTWGEFLSLVHELPVSSLFWRALWEERDAERDRKKQVEEQRAEQRKQLGLGPPPSFRHRSRR